ncbi:MAG: hypothetical protein BGO25_05195 [Acidobacteriales bacterium 59-55]|nr:MAG: hypothetical protein BGO25_05195 [Acidobacteriales bacterium 59-55]
MRSSYLWLYAWFWGVVLCPGGQFAQQLIQALETLLPDMPIAFKPFIGLGKRANFQATWPALSVASPRDQTGLLKNSKVPGNGRLADREGLHQFCHRGFAGCEPSEDRSSRWVS